VVIRPRGSDLRVGAPSDLLDPRIRRFALPSEVVPLGGYGRRWLQERGLLDALGPRIVVTEHARATLAAVAQGHADAAIVYATDAATSPGVEVAWAIPDGEQPSILYAIATPGEGDVAPATERFVTLVQGPDGERILQSAGFVWRAKDPSVAAPIASGPRP
jgi:molybdate transport system substrate-binding protein